MARPSNNVVWLEKTCSVCEIVKPHTDFYKNPLRPGLKSECIDCNKAGKKKYLKSTGHVVKHSKTVPLEKACSKCRVVKSHVGFYKSKGTLTSQCKECTDTRLKNYNYENKEKRQKFSRGEYSRSANFKKLYGITLDDVRKIHEEQFGLCANSGCGKEIFVDADRHDKYEAGKKAFVDHCHDTGKVRGLLCIGCNTALGHLEQKNKVLGLVQYLHKHGKSLF